MVEIAPQAYNQPDPPVPNGTQEKGDFFLNGNPDLPWRNTNTGQNVLWPMNGTNTKSCSGPVLSNGLPSMPAGWVISGTADFTGDCNNDILWTMPGTTNVLLWTMMGPSFICSNWMPALTLSNEGIAATGDFNGDGKPDLIVTNSSAAFIRLMNGTRLLLNSSGAETDVTISSAPSGTPQITGAGDFTGSGQTDVLWRDYATGIDVVSLMQGTNFLTNVTVAADSNPNWRIQGVGDFNGDGVSDILWRNATNGANRIWLMGSPLGTNYTNVSLPSVTDSNWYIGGLK